MRLPAFKLERYFAEHEFGVEYSLCSSDCESMSVGELLDLEPDARERFERHWLGYTESPGSPFLRQEISRIYKGVTAEEILVHSGAEEAIFLFMHASLEPGDHVIVHSPCYRSLADVARSIGCDVTPWDAREEHGWAVDVEQLQRAIRPRTRVIVVNTPHNPTGYLLPRQDLLHLVDLAEARGILIFSDEVYRESEYDASGRLPAACDLSDRAVSLGVMSKTYGLPGLRIGWVATRNAALRARMAELKDYTTICNSAPSEFLAALALRHRERLVRRSVDRITANLRLLDGVCRRHGDRLAWQRPTAGPIAFPRLIGQDVGIFCEALRRDSSVLLLPGTVYEDRGNHFRVGFGRASFPPALARLEAFLEAQRARQP